MGGWGWLLLVVALFAWLLLVESVRPLWREPSQVRRPIDAVARGEWLEVVFVTMARQRASLLGRLVLVALGLPATIASESAQAADGARSREGGAYWQRVGDELEAERRRLGNALRSRVLWPIVLSVAAAASGIALGTLSSVRWQRGLGLGSAALAIAVALWAAIRGYRIAQRLDDACHTLREARSALGPLDSPDDPRWIASSLARKAIASRLWLISSEVREVLEELRPRWPDSETWERLEKSVWAAESQSGGHLWLDEAWTPIHRLLGVVVALVWIGSLVGYFWQRGGTPPICPLCPEGLVRLTNEVTGVSGAELTLLWAPLRITHHSTSLGWLFFWSAGCSLSALIERFMLSEASDGDTNWRYWGCPISAGLLLVAGIAPTLRWRHEIDASTATVRTMECTAFGRLCWAAAEVPFAALGPTRARQESTDPGDRPEVALEVVTQDQRVVVAVELADPAAADRLREIVDQLVTGTGPFARAALPSFSPGAPPPYGDPITSSSAAGSSAPPRAVGASAPAGFGSGPVVPSAPIRSK